MRLTFSVPVAGYEAAVDDIALETVTLLVL